MKKIQASTISYYYYHKGKNQEEMHKNENTWIIVEDVTEEYSGSRNDTSEIN